LQALAPLPDLVVAAALLAAWLRPELAGRDGLRSAILVVLVEVGAAFFVLILIYLAAFGQSRESWMPVGIGLFFVAGFTWMVGIPLGQPWAFVIVFLLIAVKLVAWRLRGMRQEARTLVAQTAMAYAVAAAVAFLLPMPPSAWRRRWPWPGSPGIRAACTSSRIASWRWSCSTSPSWPRWR
jgi:hypothetical protein